MPFAKTLAFMCVVAFAMPATADRFFSICARPPAIRDAYLSALIMDVSPSYSPKETAPPKQSPSTRHALEWRERCSSVDSVDAAADGNCCMDVPTKLAKKDGPDGRGIWLLLSGALDAPLKAGDFNRLSNVRHLELAENEINSLPPNTFKGLSGLKTLTLADNNLTVSGLNEKSFSGLDKLNTLILDGNNLEGLPSGMLSGDARSVTQLQIRRNRLGAFPRDALYRDKRPKRLVILDLSHNPGIRRLPADFNGLFKRHEDMRSLNLDNVGLGSIPIGAFSNAKSLRRLRLGGNHLREMPRMRGAKKLLELHLHTNLIADMPTRALFGLDDLNTLRLSTNRLASVSLSGSPQSLERLYLDDNFLEEAPSVSHLGGLRLLDLRHNLLTALPHFASSGQEELHVLVAHNCLPPDADDGLNVNVVGLDRQNPARRYQGPHGGYYWACAAGAVIPWSPPPFSLASVRLPFAGNAILRTAPDGGGTGRAFQSSGETLVSSGGGDSLRLAPEIWTAAEFHGAARIVSARQNPCNYLKNKSFWRI